MVNRDLKNSELETAAHCFFDEGSAEAKEAVINAAEALVNYYAGIYSRGIFSGPWIVTIPPVAPSFAPLPSTTLPARFVTSCAGVSFLRFPIGSKISKSR